MAEEELNLLQFTSGLVAKPGTVSAKIVWSEYADAAVYGRFSNDGPDHLCCKSAPLNFSGPAYGTEEHSLP